MKFGKNVIYILQRFYKITICLPKIFLWVSKNAVGHPYFTVAICHFSIVENRLTLIYSHVTTTTVAACTPCFLYTVAIFLILYYRVWQCLASYYFYLLPVGLTVSCSMLFYLLGLRVPCSLLFLFVRFDVALLPIIFIYYR